MGSKRLSSMELLRIIAAFAVVVLHYCARAYPVVSSSSSSHFLLFLQSASSFAVDAFILISGYFMCTSNKRTWDKPISLIWQASLYYELAYLIKVSFGSYPLTLRSIASSFVPDSYFAVLFVVLYIVSPYINRLISHFTNKEFGRFMFICLAVFSIWPTFVDLSQEIIGVEWFGLSSIGAWGNQSGFNITNFILLYLVGAYLRIVGIPDFLSSRKKNCIYLIGTILLIFVWAEFDVLHCTHFGVWSAFVYHNPLIIFVSVLLFAIFKDFKFESSIINKFASSCYVCYLINCQILDELCIGDFANKGIGVMSLHIIASLVICLIISFVVSVLYNKCFSRLLEKLRLDIKY